MIFTTANRRMEVNMANKIDKRSLMTDLRLIKRGCGIVKELSPGLLGLSLLNSLFSAFTPYIAIYMSAVIVDELVGKGNFELLIFYVAVTVGTTLLMTIVSELITCKINVMNAMFEAKFNNYLNNIKLSMDFIKLEDPKYTDLRAKIMGTMFMVGGGITSIVGLITSIANNTITIIIAILILQGATRIHNIRFDMVFLFTNDSNSSVYCANGKKFKNRKYERIQVVSRLRNE